jgi:hypothetical protein
MYGLALAMCSVHCGAAAQQDTVVTLPAGVQAVWDLESADRQSTATREQVCINGLWRWQPAEEPSSTVPGTGWGYFKVPGCWPGISDYMQKDCQTVFRHPSWRDSRLGDVTVAWYEREITVPAAWTGRRIVLDAEPCALLDAAPRRGQESPAIGRGLAASATAGFQPGLYRGPL